MYNIPQADTISAVGYRDIMNTSPYTIRNYKPSDFDKLVLLSQEGVKTEPYVRPVSEQAIADWLAWPNFSPEKDLYVVETDDSLVGYIDVRAELGIGRVVLFCWVHPQHRRHGLATRLLDYAVHRARELGASAAHVDIGENNSVARKVLSKLGFQCVRRFFELELDMSRVDWEEAQQTAQGCRHFKRGEEAELTEIQNRSFADHWGYNPNTVETTRFSINLSHTSPEDVIFTCEEDKIIGFCWTEVIGDNQGRIYMIGTDPNFQGKGIGKKSLLAGLLYLKSKDINSSILTVDSENKAALKLYRAVGFERRKTTLSFEKVIE